MRAPATPAVAGPRPSQARPVQARSYQERTVPFATADGRRGNVIQVRGPRAPTRGTVLLVHGAGVRANIFRAPTAVNVVDYLVAAGFDVWLENWRASIDLPRCEWTLDAAAAFDHPAAVRTVARESGADEIAAVVHCQGSTSFVMAAAAGLLPQVSTVVSNAVSLHPVVPRVSRAKLDVLIPAVARLTPYLNPQWGLRPPTALARWLTAVVRLTHRECDNIVCRWASFTYGTGFPVLWRHENLDDATHAWLSGEFADVPLSFFRQMARCVRAGHLLAVDGLAALPANPVARAPRTDARFTFVAGRLNCCFLPESQERTAGWFDRHAPGRHALHVFDGYSHLDVFMGKDAARDTFPTIARALDPRALAPAATPAPARPA